MKKISLNYEGIKDKKSKIIPKGKAKILPTFSKKHVIDYKETKSFIK